MRALIATLGLFAGLHVGTASAEISPQDIPPDSKWYIHVSLAAMENNEAGATVLDWLNDEVTDEIEEDTGLQPLEEVDEVLLYGDGDENFVMRIVGELSDEALERIREQIDSVDDVTTRNDGWGEYYIFEDADREMQIDSGEVNINTDTIYASMARDNALIVTSNADLLAAEVRGVRGGNNNVLILDGPNPFIQIGVNTDELGASGTFDFDSDLLRKTSKVALMIGSTGDAFDFQTLITATDPQVTDSMANIVRGLIGLQTLSGEIPQPVSDIINSLRVESDSTGMSIKAYVAPDQLKALLED